jgi:hypothetical protein
VLLAEVAAGRGLALLPASFMQLRRAGVVIGALAQGEALAVAIGLATAADRPAWRDALRALCPAPGRPTLRAPARRAVKHDTKERR